MAKPLNELLQTLKQQDVDILYMIYQYRCLSLLQIKELKQQRQTLDDAKATRITKTSLRLLKKEELLKEEEYLGDRICYFLTPLGIEIIRHFFELPTNIYDSKRKVVRRGYYLASELSMYPKLINHQIHLNQFVIEYMATQPSIPWRYYDEKYVSQYTSIRPDGMISFADIDLFLEMDMGTESRKQLCDKWENYRNFLNSQEYAFREKRIVVFFICENVVRTKERVALVKHTIYERLLDKMEADFDIMVGSKEDLLAYLTNVLIPSFTRNDLNARKIEHFLSVKHKFVTSDGDRLSRLFPDADYRWYIRKLDEEQKILVKEGRIQEFLVDDYEGAPVSIVAKVSYWEKNTLYFQNRFKRKIGYIIVAESEQQIRDDLRMIDMHTQENIFFTTIHRMEHLSFHRALFQFDLLGNLYSFENAGLERRVFEPHTFE
ncbi:MULTISPECIES: replication-relaxation family protein [unclassified Psychrobacillus]|uniref:replication-relaxation family protein n=1 Tax=unclassified Psychrobacillus TaxID=2636677 RepID=UPI0030FCD11E